MLLDAGFSGASIEVSALLRSWTILRSRIAEWMHVRRCGPGVRRWVEGRLCSARRRWSSWGRIASLGRLP